MLSNITKVDRSIGGCAANTAVNIAKIDSSIPLKVYGCVGDDENGTYIIDYLKQYAIDIRGVKRIKSSPSSFTDVMIEERDGIRTFFHARGANACFDIKDIDFRSIDAKYFHIGYTLLLDG